MSTARRTAAPSPAYVLHRYDWSETSLILDLFTRDQGRVTVAAKGAKRPYSQLRPVLLPFQRIAASFSRPVRDEQTEVFTLRGAEWAGGAPMLSGAALFSGFYLNELLMKMLGRGDPYPVLFDAYTGTLPALAAEQETLTQACLRAFELVLLREVGLLPQLDRITATQELVRPAAAYVLRPELGVAPLSHGEASIDGAQLQALQRLLDQGELSALQRACADSLPALKAMLRPLLHYHLGTPRLRTREVMIEAQQMMESHLPTDPPSDPPPELP